MFCPNCGTSNDPGARFCANCGQPLSNETIVPNMVPNIAPPKKKALDSRASIGIIVAMAVIVLAVCVFFIHVNEKKFS